MVVKKIFDGAIDEEVHNDFMKYGKGEFHSKYLISGKRQKDKWVLKTGAEMVNHLVRKCLKKVSGKIQVNGIIVSTINLGDDELGFEVEKRKNFMGIRQLVINSEIEPENILDLMEKQPRIFFALSFKGDDFEIKVKKKMPRSPKPSTKGDGEAKAEFCTLKTNDFSLMEDVLFDYKEFKMISIYHTIKIESIVYPEGMKDMKPEEIREKAKKKGVIVRHILIDDVEKVSEKEFVA